MTNDARIEYTREDDYRFALAKTKILEDALSEFGYEITEEIDGLIIACVWCGFPKDEGHADDCNADTPKEEGDE